MEKAIILQSKYDINSFLDNKELWKAFNRLKELVKDTENWNLIEKMEQLETAYQYMLHYMSEGIVDPEREKLYRKICSDAYNLTDLAVDQLLMKNVSSLYYSQRRVNKSSNENLSNAYNQLDNDLGNQSLNDLVETIEKEDRDKKLQLEKKVEEDAKILFNLIWSNINPTEQELQTLKQLFAHGSLKSVFQAQMISALTLSLLEFYDDQKLMILLDLLNHKNDLIRIRALVGLTIILCIHEKRAALNTSIQNRLQLLLENTTILKELQTIQLQFIRARETERISKKLNEEILPDMIKMGNNVFNKIKTDDPTNELNEIDKNPEWEDYLEKSGIRDKLKEISELQLEGSDVLLSAFSNLKNYPFFGVLANWFLPFFPGNSILCDESLNNMNQQFVSFIKDSKFMCNSDKYSFCISLIHMPEMQRKIIVENFASQSQEIEEMQKVENDSNTTVESEKISNLYIQDLYRFFKIHPQHTEFNDPFKHNLLFYKNSLLKDFFDDMNQLEITAELLFKKEYYNDAVDVYELIAQKDNSRYTCFQKIGYCYQRMNQLQKAKNAYLQADIIHPDSIWTLRKLALCTRSLKQFQEAMSYYERILSLDPNNLAAELNLGHCLYELGQTENALKHYFKVDYLDHNNIKVARSIAWCSFLINKYAQAERYYQKILDSSPLPVDYLNMGHTQWVQGRIPEAIKNYKEAIVSSSEGKSFIELTFAQDKKDLLHAGIKETDYYLMLDQLLYEPNKN